MRMRQISPHVWQVRLWRYASVHVWLVADDAGLSLVDTGFSFMASDVLHAVRGLAEGPLTRILLTHGHPDHAGGAAALARLTGARVFAHAEELPFLTSGHRYPRIPPFLQPSLAGLVEPLPDVERATVGGYRKLRPLGGLSPWLTPGHTPGHVVYHHEEDNVLLAGDLFKARRGRLMHLGHLYSLDPARARRSEGILPLLEPARLEASHGGGVVDPLSALT